MRPNSLLGNPTLPISYSLRTGETILMMVEIAAGNFGHLDVLLLFASEAIPRVDNGLKITNPPRNVDRFRLWRPNFGPI